MEDRRPAVGPPSPTAVLEAMLFVGAQPIHSELLRHRFGWITPAIFERMVFDLKGKYRRQRRPYDIVRTEGGFILRLNTEHRRELARRLRPERPARLSRSILETLSMIAYRQPISRADLETALGNPVSGPLRQLQRRRLVEAIPDRSPPCFRTTSRFLEIFGLQSLDELPAIEDLGRL